jgi:hypothetical protein
MRCGRKFVKMLAYLLSAAIFIFMYLSLVDLFSGKNQNYDNVLVE